MEDDYDNDVILASSEVINEKETKSNNKIKVEIKGAVEKPGVYDFTTNNIINDLVTLAGGFKENAFSDNINLSKKLEDQMVIYVYTKNAYSKLKDKEKVTEIKTCNCPEVDISKCLNTGQSIIENKKETTSDSNKDETISNDSTSISLVNINTATINELMTLNGIGEAKAKSIIEYRETNGYFIALEDIKKVSGISDAIYEKIKNYISI